MANQPEHVRSAFWTRGLPPLEAAVAPIPPPVEIVKSWGLFVGDQEASSMAENVDRLFDSVKALEEKIVQAKEEKEQLIARARTAQTTSKVNEMLSD
ncbi:unnamed protein product, partial [Prorocentrum cordatum]